MCSTTPSPSLIPSFHVRLLYYLHPFVFCPFLFVWLNHLLRFIIIGLFSLKSGIEVVWLCLSTICCSQPFCSVMHKSAHQYLYMLIQKIWIEIEKMWLKSGKNAVSKTFRLRKYLKKKKKIKHIPSYFMGYILIFGDYRRLHQELLYLSPFWHF